MKNIIVTEGLTKTYNDFEAVSQVSLNVRKGEIYGFLGLNGAGKTTSIRMLLGMIRPTTGNAYINEKKVSANSTEIWKDVGSLVETPYSYPNLTVRENLHIIRRLRFLRDKSMTDRIIDLLQLNQYADRKAKNLSLGNAQRLGIAKALIHQPKILILDEPTNGLDPAGILEIREMLCNLAKNEGVTIFISSHILGEIARLASRIGIIHCGKLIEELDAEQLSRLCQKQLLVKTENNTLTSQLLKEKQFSGITEDSGLIRIRDHKAIDNPSEIAKLLVNSGYPPSLLSVKEEDLESFFLRTIKTNTTL